MSGTLKKKSNKFSTIFFCLHFKWRSLVVFGVCCCSSTTVDKWNDFFFGRKINFIKMWKIIKKAIKKSRMILSPISFLFIIFLFLLHNFSFSFFSFTAKANFFINERVEVHCEVYWRRRSCFLAQVSSQTQKCKLKWFGNAMHRPMYAKCFAPKKRNIKCRNIKIEIV